MQFLNAVISHNLIIGIVLLSENVTVSPLQIVERVVHSFQLKLSI